MLVAWHNRQRVEAREAERGETYLCPNCETSLILRRGRIMVPHFAHRPQAVCDWAAGETPAHLSAKAAMRDALVARGLRADVEQVVAGLEGDRRADVLAWSPTGEPVAIELQHTAIGLDELEARAAAYAAAGIAQLWLPFLRPGAWNGARRPRPGEDGVWVMERYAVRGWERWIAGFGGELWLYDPRLRALWRGRLEECRIFVKEQRWRAADGREVVREARAYASRRWARLRLWGPTQVGDLRLAIRQRRPGFSEGAPEYPLGPVARLVPWRPDDVTARRCGQSGAGLSAR
jgi:competence protein CoiA